MGIYIYYQAMPECELLERSRRDPEFGDCLFSFRYCVTDELGDKPIFFPPYTAIQLEFIQEAKRTAQLYTGLEYREWTHHKGCTEFFYIIADKHSQGKSNHDWTDLLDKAIVGGDIVHEKLLDAYDYPLRYVSPVEVKQIVELFSSLVVTNKGLKSYFDEFIASKPLEVEPFEYIEQFRDFWDCLKRPIPWYEEAAAHNEGMLVYL